MRMSVKADTPTRYYLYEVDVVFRSASPIAVMFTYAAAHDLAASLAAEWLENGERLDKIEKHDGVLYIGPVDFGVLVMDKELRKQ